MALYKRTVLCVQYITANSVDEAEILLDDEGPDFEARAEYELEETAEDIEEVFLDAVINAGRNPADPGKLL